MRIRRHIGKIMMIAGVIIFAFGIWRYTSLDDQSGSLYLALGIVSVFFLGFIGIAVEVIAKDSGRPVPKNEVRPVSPLRYERESVRYCPFCHANLGSDDPDRCPECGHVFRERHQE